MQTVRRAAGANSLRCSTVRLTRDEHRSAGRRQQLRLPPAPLGCGDQDGAASQQQKSTGWRGKQWPHGGLQQSHARPHAGRDTREQRPQQAQDECQGQKAGSGLHPPRTTDDLLRRSPLHRQSKQPLCSLQERSTAHANSGMLCPGRQMCLHKLVLQRKQEGLKIILSTSDSLTIPIQQPSKKCLELHSLSQVTQKSHIGVSIGLWGT